MKTVSKRTLFHMVQSGNIWLFVWTANKFNHLQVLDVEEIPIVSVKASNSNLQEFIIQEVDRINL